MRRPASPVPPTLPLPPGPPRAFPLGQLGAFRADPLGFLLTLARRHGDVVRVPMGPRVLTCVFHPDGVRRVLQEQAPRYTKQTPGFDVLRELLGQGLLTSEGTLWLRQRRLAQPAFHRQRLAGFATLMVRAAQALAEAWAPLAGRPQPVDVAGAMAQLTLRVAGEALFSTDVSGEAAELSRALSVVLPFANDRLTRPFALPRALPTPANRAAARAGAVLDRVVRGLIAQRRRHGGPDDDLLALLMQAEDADTGERMGDTQLRDEVLTLLLAGHETTANALCWTWTLLSRAPGVRRLLEGELATVLGGRAPTLEDVPRLAYTRQVIDEVLRLYPPAWVFSRSPDVEDELGGYRIPARSFVVLSPWVTHRLPAVWDNPEGFDPERFHPEAAAGRPRFAYFPFGGGPRQCIGNAFALLELTLVVATLAQRLRLDLEPGLQPAPEPTLTLRPRGGLWMRVAGA